LTVLEHKRQEILKDMKAGFENFVLPVIDEINMNGTYAITTKFQYQHYGFGIMAEYHPDGDLTEISICYGNAPEKKIKSLSELMNHLNCHILSGHFCVVDPDGEMLFRTAVHTPDFLNKDDFEWALNQVMATSYRFFPMIVNQLFSDESPMEILKKHLNNDVMEVA